MKRQKCLDCTKLMMCDVNAEFQREANNFMQSDNARDAFMEANKKVEACKDRRLRETEHTI